MTDDRTIGLTSFEAIFKKESYVPFKYSLREENPEDFCLYTEPNPYYVFPIFSLKNFFSTDTKLENAQVILISAAGATGKSELVKRLSYDLKCPVVDLGKSKVVASDSLTGRLYKSMKRFDAAEYSENLAHGNSVLIIDALDEGYQKTTTVGYYNYLDDVITYVAKDRPSIILLGRTNAVELAALYLSDHGISTAMLQIEPFTIVQAKEFIDKQIGRDNSAFYEKSYKDARDYIIEAIGCFFKSQGEINELQYARFIGYAPVLLAISSFLKDGSSNFYKVLENLRRKNLKNVSLILDIAHEVLLRDKQLKVDENLLKRLVEHRDPGFKTKVMECVYTPEEQCARVLYKFLGETYPFYAVDDPTFNNDYNNGLEEWISEHPFIKDNHPSNIVFESYMLALLLPIEKYKDAVYRYLRKYPKCSYAFFYIFNEMYSGSVIDACIVPYLFASLKELDNDNCYYSLELECEKEELEVGVTTDLFFFGSDDAMTEYEYKVNLDNSTVLQFGDIIADINVDAPVKVSIPNSKVSLISPSRIKCKTLQLKCDELLVNHRYQTGNFLIESDDIIVEPSSGNLNIQETDKNCRSLVIVSGNRLNYPLCDYQKDKSLIDDKMDQDMLEHYMKMRRILIMFRSHSKGQLAKYKDKIDNHLGATMQGKKVIAALLKYGIIYPEGHVYIIDNEKMDECLGVKFDGIRSCTITDAMRDFLKKIVS